MKVPVSNVVQMPSAQAQPKINPTMLAMAAHMMIQEGKLGQPQEQQVAMNLPDKEQVPMAEAGQGGGGSAGGAMRQVPYEKAPDSLMGFSKSGPQKGYYDTNYKYELSVRVTSPNGDSWEDGIKGLNKAHALERARRNWPGSTIEPLK